MTRLMLMTFFGEQRWRELRRDGHEYHPHEAPTVMTMPMIVLAVGSVGRRLHCSRQGCRSTGWRRRWVS